MKVVIATTLPRIVERNRYNSRQIRLIGSYLWAAAWLIASAFMGTGAEAQVNVLTAHNDTARTGQNLNETILTPSNVNTTQFGKLFTYGVTGAILAQPLYAQQVAIGGKLHNVVYVATTSDYVYAFDADTNGGANANPLWQASLLTNSTPAGTLTNVVGVWGTPVIDPSTKTMYLVSSEMKGTAPIFRFHALDITTGAEKFGGPLQIKASTPGTGVGSTGGVVTFDPTYHRQRPGLLLLHGVVYASFGSVNDEGPWHGWIFSYAVNPTTQTLQQVDIFCLTPNGSGAGLWMGGAALAGEVNNPAKPYGRLFVATGNGTFGIGAPTVSGQPYSNPSNEYGMSVLDVDLTGGVMTVEDLFTPYNEAFLNGYDLDTGSGGPVLLPTQTLASGKTLKPLVQTGKVGMFYILDRDNNTDGSNNAATEYSPAGLGGFNSTADQVVQEFQTPIASGFVGGAGVWGTEAYWNNTIYSGGTTTATTTSGSTATTGTHLSAYSFVNGVISTTPTSQSVEQYFYWGPTPSISANGNTNGILWTLNHTTTNVILEAYDATNLANLLYSNSENLYPAEYAVPTIANGKVYVGTSGFLIAYGLLAGEPQAPSPVITPGTSTFNSPITVRITDPIAGATIYYTTNGSTPNTGSTVYSSTHPPVVSTPETITAIASIAGYLQSAPSSATYTSTTIPANPVFSPGAGTYTGTQTLTITEPSRAVVYYTVDGSAPTTASLVYTRPLTISTSQTVQAVAVAPGPFASAVVSAAYTIQPVGTINFQGFTLADGPIQFNGSTGLDDFRLQLTNGGTNEAGSAFYATPVNIQQFTTNFTFQLSNPSADGITFTIQGNGPTSLGGAGGQLGYGGIPDSVAIKFDIHNNAGEGSDSTGLYINGAIPAMPAIDLSTTGINLHSGDYFNVTLTYDGSNLTLTLTDAITLATWSHVFVVNIPAIIEGNTAYVGFTGATGGLTASQKLTSWTYVPGPPLPSYAAGFTPGSMTLNRGASISGSTLVLTDGGINESRSAFFTTPVNIQQFTTNFQFQLLNPVADGFTFTIQGHGPTAVGIIGGSLGYGGVSNSVAVKFDLFNNSGEGSDSTGLYINGALPTVPAIDLSSTGINLHSGDVFNVQLSYDGITLTVVITDTVTNATATQSYTVDIPYIVAGPKAWVGFSGGTGGLTAIQEILNWSYSPALAVEPAFFAGFAGSQSQMTLNGVASLYGPSLRLTDGNVNEAGSAFFTAPLSIQKFVSVFDFQLTNPNGDGFTFAIEGSGPTALGASGGQLGYGGTPNNSVAIKFDLFNNLGEGPDSTGIYTNGAAPILPAINLTGTGINLHSGDPFNTVLTYDGTTLTVLITDKVTNASATQSYTINIPSIIGGTTAFVGFTGGSGGSTAVQEILDWNYAAAAVN